MFDLFPDMHISADPALQGKRRVKQCLPLKSSSKCLWWSCSICVLSLLSRNVVFEVIVALTPSLLFFFYLRGESERGSWSPDYHLRPPLGVPPGGRTSFTRYPLRGMKNDGANVCTNTSTNCLYASEPKVEPTSLKNYSRIKKGRHQFWLLFNTL